jgi:hypothetical protein
MGREGGRTEERRPLGRSRCSCVDNIKMYLRKTGWGGMDLIDLAQDTDHWREVLEYLHDW